MQNIIDEFFENDIYYGCTKKSLMGKKRVRDAKHKKRLEFLNKNVVRYPSPAYRKSTITGYYVDNDEDNEYTYIKRCYRGNHRLNRYRFYKKYCNRIVRRYTFSIPRGGSYKKVAEYFYLVD